MKIQSTRFGTLEIDEKKVLNFPYGLLGMENSKRYTLLHEENNVVSNIAAPTEPRELQHIVHYLQSLDDPDLTLPVVDPSIFGFDYDMTLTDQDSRMIEVRGGDYIAVMLIVSKYPQEAYHSDMPVFKNVSANINAPLLINTRSRIGIQVVLPTLSYDVVFRQRAEQQVANVSARP